MLYFYLSMSLLYCMCLQSAAFDAEDADKFADSSIAIKYELHSP